MVGTPLVNCDPEGIKFLFDVLQEVSDILQDASLPSAKMAAMNGVKRVLREALEGYRRSGGDTGSHESQNLSESDCSAGDSEHVNDRSGMEEWSFDKLCKWIIDQIRENGLEDNGKCKQIMFKLEERCTSPNTANETPSQAIHGDNSQGGAIEGAHDSSPISLLPVELLQHIFSLVASPPRWVRAPLVLSLVNSHFRTIVLDTPSLWAAIDNSLSLTILQLYITRSKNEPLDVLIRTDDAPSESTWSTEGWFNFLNDKSTRIEHMAVVGDYPNRISPWVTELELREEFVFTGLTRLALRVVSGDDDRVLCPTWAHFPNLRELWLQMCWCNGWVCSDDPFPRTLRRLRLTKIRCVPLLTFLNALDMALGLVSLVMEDFDLDCDEPHDQPIRSQVALNSLEELELTNVSITNMNILSLYLSTPNLSSLSITSSAPCDGITDFLAAFTVHRPQLYSLRILGFNLELRALKKSLDNLANLTHLSIRASEVADNDLSLLEEGELSPRIIVAVS